MALAYTAKNEGKITALYCRLCRDDELQGYLTEIYFSEVTQMTTASKYAVFVDDGLSGTNFGRHDWQRLIALVDEGAVGTIIIKDMSRLGRDYLKVGYYTAVEFPNGDVRFIAINNGVDSDSKQDSDFAPFFKVEKVDGHRVQRITIH